MAYIGRCKFCGETTINSSAHPECQTVFNEDLLHQIRDRVSKKPNDPLPRELISQLTLGKFQSLEEWKEARSQQQELQKRQDEWQEAKEEYLSRASEEFDKNNPEPNPPRC